MAVRPNCNTVIILLSVFTFWTPPVLTLPGGWLDYPVYEGDPEFLFAVSAVKALRKNCNLPDIPLENFTVFDDECSYSIVDSSKLIWLSIEVDTGTDEPRDFFVEISSEETVGDVGASAERSTVILGNYTLIGVFNTDDEMTDAKFCNYSLEASRRASNHRALVGKSTVPKPYVRYSTSPTITDDMWSTIPTNWDWRLHMPSEIYWKSKAAASIALSQGGCGSCYVFGGVTAMAYRFNIASNGTLNAVPSPEIVMSCTNGCNGGGFDLVYNAMMQNFIPSDAAEPYIERTKQCVWNGSNSIWYKNRLFTMADDSAMPSDDPQPYLKAVKGERAMMYEVFMNGPGGVYVKVEDQFQGYSGDGVLMDKTCAKGSDGVTCVYTSADTNHACALIGWGSDNGVKYWLIQNSWGPGWGMNGFLKLARGVNALGVETDGVMVGAVDSSNVCPASPVCRNGGTYLRNCSCQCPIGWSGPSCEICAKNCSWQTALTLPGTTGIVNGSSCVCQCADGYTDPNNLLGFPDCGLRALLFLPGDSSKAYSKTVIAQGQVSFEFGIAFSQSASPISNMNMVKQGDMLVAVDVGKLPWTPEADWGTTKFKADICGPKNWNSAENTPVLCSGVSRGNITISEEGMYDIYFIKYDGKSEFGVDKGYGKDFFKLKQKLCTFVNTTKCDSINNQSDQNRAAQLAQIQQLSAQSAKDLESAKSAAKEIADQKLAAFVAKNKARIIPFKFKLFGFGSEYIGKDEKAAIETVVAEFIGSVCGEESGLVRNCTNKDVKLIDFQDIAPGTRTLAKPGAGSISFNGNLTAKSPELATVGFRTLLTSNSTAMLAALKRFDKTYLQYITDLRNSMFCDGKTVKCPSIPSSTNSAGNLHVTAYTYSEHNFLMKDLVHGSSGDLAMDFLAWQVKLDGPIFARQRCSPNNVLTLDEVWQQCNPSGSANAMSCALPIKFQCGDQVSADVWNYNSLSSGQALFGPNLVLGFPIDSPFLHLLTTIPQVPVYDLERVNQMQRRDDVINLFAVTDVVSGEVNKYANPSLIFNSSKLASCQRGVVIIGDDCPSCLYDFVPSLDSSTPIQKVYTNVIPFNKPCKLDDIVKFEQDLGAALDKINNASSKAEFTKAVNTLNVVENLDAFVGCNALIESMTAKTPTPILVFGGRNCEIDPSDPLWRSDPCCNYQLQFTMCCAEQTRQVTINKLSGINYDIVNATVPNDNASTWILPRQYTDPDTSLPVWFPSENGYVASPARQAVIDSVTSALSQHVQADTLVQDSSQGCEAKLKSVLPPDYLSLALGFLSKCIDIIFNSKTTTGKGKCALDSDCYTSCNRNTHRCTPPTSGPQGNLDNALVRCSIDKMRPDVLLYVRDLLNVESLPVDDGPLGPGFNARMSQALTDAVTSYDCDGPSEYSDGACFIDMPDSECMDPALQQDPYGYNGNGMTLSQAAQLVDGNVTYVNTILDQHNGMSVQFNYIIIRKDITDMASCLQLKPNSDYVEWVNVTFNGGQGFGFDVTPQNVYTRSVCRIKNPPLPNLDQGFSAPTVTLCADGTIPGANGLCADGSIPGYSNSSSSGPVLCPDSTFADPNCGCTCGFGNMSGSGSGIGSGIGDGSSSGSDAGSGSGSGSSMLSRRQGVSYTCPSNRRTAADPCDQYTDDSQAKYDCVLSSHFLFLCKALPDIEHMFDPDASVCTTLANVYPQLSVVNHLLPGVGRCKVSNFGITPNGLLPFGYMTDDASGNYLVDWRSPDTQYLDAAQNPVNISASGTVSIAETRCKQTRNALKALGFSAKAGHFYRYKSVTKTIYDPTTDQFFDRFFPGNKTMCELERKCNSDTVSAMSAKTALTFDQCTNKTSSKSRSFCGLPMDSSSLMDLTALPLCYIDQGSSSKEQCDTWGGAWDSIEFQQNPQSSFTCSANDLFGGPQNCWNACSNQSYFDSFSGFTYVFHGECEAYHLCTINVNMSTCYGAAGLPQYKGTVQWMKFDYSAYALVSSSDNDQSMCVIRYVNKWDSLDSGGDTSIDSSKTCTAKSIVYNGKSYSGIARPARSYRAGFLNSSDLCSNGICASQLWDPTSSCALSQGSCSVPCGGCRALMDYEPAWYQLDPRAEAAASYPYLAPVPRVAYTGGMRQSVCHDPTFTNATICNSKDGLSWSYSHNLCYVTADAGSCQSPRIRYTCDPISKDTCPSILIYATDNTTILLQCVFDRQMDCSNQATCEMDINGACDDSFLEDPSMPPWVPAGPACVVPFKTGDAYGYPNTSDCDTDAFVNGIAFEDPKIGCIYWPQRLSTSITVGGISISFGNTTDAQEATCLQAGGYWTNRSRNQNTCENSNRSWACLVDQAYTVNIDGNSCSNDAVCSQIDYSWENIRSWSIGSWSASGSALQTSWIDRTWGPINVWTGTFDFNKLTGLITTAVGNKMQQAFGSYVQCSLGLYGAAFAKIAAAVDPNVLSGATGSNSGAAQTSSSTRRSLNSSQSPGPSLLNPETVKITELTAQTFAIDIQPIFDVVIIGAGIAGIAAARELVDLGYNVLVIESKKSIGGRLKTNRSLGFPVELGSSWLYHKDSNPMTPWLQQYGIPSKVVNYDSLRRFRSNGTQYSDSETRSSAADDKYILSQIFAAITNSTTDSSLAALAQQVSSANLSGSETEQWHMSTGEELEYGGSAETISAKMFGATNQFNGSGYDVSIPKGFDQLINQSNLANNITILNSTRVVYIDYSNETVAIATSTGQFFMAKTAIITVPLGVLKNSDIGFNPPLPAWKQQAIQKVQMGTLNKVYLGWKNMSWVPQTFNNFSFIGVDVASPTIHTRGLFNYFINMQRESGIPGFMTFATGQSGQDIESWNDTYIINVSVSQLQKAVSSFGGGAVPLPDNWLITRWNRDPDAYGAFSYANVNVTNDDFNALANPVQGSSTILFAGEHTSASDRGTVHGAFVSGQSAANQAITLLMSASTGASPSSSNISIGTLQSRRLLSSPSTTPVPKGAKSVVFPPPKKPLSDPQMKCPAGGITIPQKTLKAGAQSLASKVGKAQSLGRRAANLKAKASDPRAKPKQAKVKDTGTFGMAVASAANFHDPSLEPKKVVSSKTTSKAKTAKSGRRGGRHLLAATTSAAVSLSSSQVTSMSSTSAIIKTTATTRGPTTSVRSSTTPRQTTVMKTAPPPIVANFTCGTCDYSGSCMTGYAIVKNSEGVVVGQLIGASLTQTGMDLSSGGGITVCFNPDPNIPQCVNETKFPIADVAYTNSSLPKSQQAFNILQINVTIGSQYCAIIASPGTGLSYWPIRRSRNLRPQAVVVVAVTLTAISDPNQFNNKTLQDAFKAATAAGLGTGIKASDVAITQVCKADGVSGCITPTTSRRLLATGVIATASVTTASAATVSSAAGGGSFSSAFVQSWRSSAAQSIVPLDASSVSAQSKGVQQPLAPLSPDSNQAKAAAAARAGAAAAGAVTTSTLRRTTSSHAASPTPAPTTTKITAPAPSPTPTLSAGAKLSPQFCVIILTLLGALSMAVRPVV